jgi:hypothetical protein
VNPHTLKLVDSKGLGAKLVQRTIRPFEVMERVNPLVYRLRLPDTFPMHPVFNLEHLCLYKQSSERFGECTKLPPTRNLLPTEEYEVEAILRHRVSSKKSGNRRMYLVRWVSYEPTEDSWISEYDLRNALQREYLRMHNLN